MRRPGRGAALALGLLLLAAPAPARARGWWVPDHAKLQLAGNVGFLSPGVGWTAGRRLDLTTFLGWVPEAVGGTDLVSVTGKLTWSPWVISHRRWILRPLTTSLQLTYTFGDAYFVVPDALYQDFTPTALRSGVSLGVAAGRRVAGRPVELYAELGALDLGLYFWLRNPEALDAADVFSLALGARVGF